MSKQLNTVAKPRPTSTMGNMKSSGGNGTLNGQDAANVSSANLLNQAKPKTNKNGEKEENTTRRISAGKPSSSKVIPSSSASIKRPGSKISSGKEPSPPSVDAPFSSTSTTAQVEASRSSRSPLYKSSNSSPPAQQAKMLEGKGDLLEEMRSIRNMLLEMKEYKEADREMLNVNTSNVKEVHGLMQQLFSRLAVTKSEDELGPEKSKLMRLENDDLKQQIKILTREKNDLKTENEELQAAQSQSRQPVRPHLSVDEDGSIATEVRALREQLALDADTIRNLENLLQLAREGSDGGAGSSAASTTLKDLELERTGLIGKREEANRKELEALRVRNRELLTQLEQLRSAQDNNQLNLSSGGASYPISEVTEGLPRWRAARPEIPVSLENSGKSFVSEVRRVTPQEHDEWAVPPARSHYVPESNSYGGNRSNQEHRLFDE